jgi:addiction module HigA family antidote
MRKRNRAPNHPGRILRKDYLEPLDISITELAGALGVSRKTTSKIVNERGGITPEMAVRLSRAFGTTPDLWMNLQSNYDLWHITRECKDCESVRPIDKVMAVKGGV